jgi:WD40 repeat protein
VLAGHKGPLTSLTFAASGQLLSGGRDGQARAWDVASGKAIVLAGHLGPVTGVAALGPGYVTASADCGVRLFAARTGKLTQLLKGHTSGVTALALAADGARFATASRDGTVRVWSESGVCERCIEACAGGAFAVRFEGARALVVEGRSHGASFSFKTGKPLAAPKKLPRARDGAGTLTGRVDAKVTYVAHENGEVHLRAGAGAPIVLGGHDDKVTHVAVSPDGALLATAAANGVIHVWAWREVAASPPPARAAVAIAKVWTRKIKGSPDTRFDGDTLWVGQGDELVAFDLAGAETTRVKSKGEVVHFGARGVAFADFDQRVTVVDRATGKKVLEAKLEGARLHPGPDPSALLTWVTERASGKNDLQILDPERQELVAALGPMTETSEEHALSRDRKWAVVASSGPRAWLWDVARAKLVATLEWEGDFAYQLGFTADGERVLVGTRSGSAHLFDRAGRRVDVQPPSKGHEGWTPLLLSAASERAVVWGQDHLPGGLYDTKSGARVATLFAKAPRKRFTARTFSPDGKVLLAALEGAPLLAFIDAASGKTIAEHEVHRGGDLVFAFYQGGARVLTFGKADKQVRAWEVATGKPLWAHLGVPGRELDYTVLAADGRYAAVTAWDWAEVRVLDVATGATVADLPGHPGYARAPSFSPGSAYLATGANDQTVNLWKLG